MQRSVRLVAMLLVAGGAACGQPAHVLIRPDAPTAGIPALIAQAPLRPDESIRATPLQRGEHASIALVQIGDREPPHIHTRYDLAVVLVRGAGTLWLSGQAMPMRAGDTAFIPKNTAHYFVNDGSEPAAALVMFAPPFDGPDQQPVAAPGS